MNYEPLIRRSNWWVVASRTADRHHPAASGIQVTDHLLAVRQIVRDLLVSESPLPYVSELRRCLGRTGLDLTELEVVLGQVALLHDIGKPQEDKSALRPHPLTGKPVPWRHPVIGAQAALELLPESYSRRPEIASLVAKHDTGWSWYRQWQASGQRPSAKAWRRLDSQLGLVQEGHGVLLLALFKLADIDGHGDPADVPWFVEQANRALLDDQVCSLPVPEIETLRQLQCLRLSTR